MPRPPRRTALPALVLVVVLGLAGCGASDPAGPADVPEAVTPSVSAPAGATGAGASSTAPAAGGPGPQTRVRAAVTPELCQELTTIVDVQLDGADVTGTVLGLADAVDAALAISPPGPEPSLRDLQVVTSQLRAIGEADELGGAQGVASWFSRLDPDVRDSYTRALGFLGLYHEKNCDGV